LGFIPITDSEVAYTAKKLKPLIKSDLVQIAEYEGEPVAFMMTLPNVNEVLARIGPKPSPLGWIKLLLWIWRPRVRTMRVPLMGVREVAVQPHGQPARFHDDRVYPPEFRGELRRQPGRDRLGSGRQSGHEFHRPRNPFDRQQGIPGLRKDPLNDPAKSKKAPARQSRGLSGIASHAVLDGRGLGGDRDETTRNGDGSRAQVKF
jgi:hypothetical protein